MCLMTLFVVSLTGTELYTADHISAYHSFLDEHMPAFPDDLFSCCDPSCRCHYNALDTVSAQLLECVRIGASSTLPKVKKNLRVVPRWNIHARPLQQYAAFWHKLWCDCGRPTSGVLSQIKKNSKKNFINMRYIDLEGKENI